MRHAILFALSGVLVAAAAACSATTTYVTTSRPAERQIAVDGRSDDWMGALSVIRDGKAEEGFLNDGQSLYICFVTEDESFGRQIATGGLTVWFDPAGGDKKALGIKYPIGRARRGRRPAPDAEEGQGEAGQERGVSDGSSLEVLRSGSAAPQRLKLSDVEGLEVASSTVGGLFVYELKIPIDATGGHSVALAAGPGDKIGVGIEASPAERGPSMGRGGEGPEGHGGMGGRGGMGGMGGRGGGMGGVGGGMYGGGRGRMGGGMGGGREMEPQSSSTSRLSVWTYVKLSGAASRPAPGS